MASSAIWHLLQRLAQLSCQALLGVQPWCQRASPLSTLLRSNHSWQALPGRPYTYACSLKLHMVQGQELTQVCADGVEAVLLNLAILRHCSRAQTLMVSELSICCSCHCTQQLDTQSLSSLQCQPLAWLSMK